MAVDDYVMTIESDDEAGPVKSSKAKDIAEEAQLNPDFIFDLSGDPYDEFLGESNVQDYVKKGSKSASSCTSSVYKNIANVAPGTHLRRRYH